jgi:diaminopropionate ammonia-lyase
MLAKASTGATIAEMLPAGAAARIVQLGGGMTGTIAGTGEDVVVCLNGLANPAASYWPEQSAILNDEALEAARLVITAWPGHAATRLVPLPGLAREARVGALFLKDESRRFGLGSFKALGGAYAVWRVLCDEAAKRGVGPDEREHFAEIASAITVCCATDGNHGRSVAWGARMFGCRCVIFIHATVSARRKQEIEAFGAKVVRCDGNYDDSVRLAEETARREGWIVVSDTSYPGYTDIPRHVMQGYELMADEAMQQWPLAEPPTHLFLQTGVGGMAAAVTAYFWRRFGAARPLVVLADPLNSDCWVETIRAGTPTAAKGDLDTIMAGLACGEVSELAWTILKPSAHAVVGIDDDAAPEGMRILAEGRFGDTPIVAGESAVAGLMALMAVADDDASRRALKLDEGSRVLVFCTEGATDPELYQRLVGMSADAVLAQTA